MVRARSINSWRRYAEFFVSEDGENFTVAGKVMSGESTEAGIVKAGVISSRLNTAVKARYVKFVIKNPRVTAGDADSLVASGWMFIDEVSVMQDDGKTPETGDTLLIPVLTFIALTATAAGTAYTVKGIKEKK